MIEIDMELVNEVEDRHRKNIELWGHQDPLILMSVLGEEFGEVNKAFLQSYYGNGECDCEDLREEVIDTMAVLVEIYQNMEMHDYERMN